MARKREGLPHEPVDLKEEELVAVQGALKTLHADPKHAVAMRFIMERLCGLYDNTYRPGGLEGDRASAFAAGRQYVGQQMRKFINLPMPTQK